MWPAVSTGKNIDSGIKDFKTMVHFGESNTGEDALMYPFAV